MPLPFPILAVAICLGAALLALLLRNRISSVALGALLALAPLSIFVLGILSVDPKGTLTASVPWLPSLGLNFSFRVDALGLLFVLLVSGIGALVTLYAGYYFAPHGDASHKIGASANEGHFFAYLLLFMASMLGLVMAGDIVTLFVFWEGTSIVSYLLVAYKYKDVVARAGAFKALFITGGGGVALLAGLILAANVAGSTDLAIIMAQSEALKASALYPVIFGLIVLGAFTKSAQFPAHIWLPDAMSAPTPASAYLHSATMVKAGIYLMARMHPALGETDLWVTVLTGVGVITMLLGAFLGLHQNDLKALLAYSTISQLGALMALLGGLSGGPAYKAFAVGVLAHALYKGALFMTAGIIDHNTGTRDLRQLGALRRFMPATFVIGLLAALSMAGLPPFFGFLSKETLLAAAVEGERVSLFNVIFPIAAVITGALMLAQAAIFALDVFYFPKPALRGTQVLPGGAGKKKKAVRVPHDEHADAAHDVHEAAPGMLAGPGVLAALGLLIALVPPQWLTDLITYAAQAAYGDKVKVSLALWTGFNIPLLLSVIAIAGGIVLFGYRNRLFPRSASQGLTAHPAALNAPFLGALRGFDAAGWLTTRLQTGQIRLYLMLMLIGTGVLLTWFGALKIPALSPGDATPLASNLLRIVTLLIAVGASAASIFLRDDFYAILALGASGLAMALRIMIEPSPDVALVQIIVDILTTIVLVLALSRLPRMKHERKRGDGRRTKESTHLPFAEAVLAIAAGVVMTMICYSALATRPRTSIVTPYYEAQSKPMTGAADIVGAIVVDFRGFDTMIEISVFSMAGIGVYMLLRHAKLKHGDQTRQTLPAQPFPPSIKGIGGALTSPFVHTLAYFVLPVAIVVGLVHMFYGHDQPGDGFTAGVIISIAMAFWYVVFGYERTKAMLPWLKAHVLIGCGITTVMIGSIAPVLLGMNFFAPVDFGQMWNLPLPEGLYLSTSTMFELAICLSVLGSATYIVDTLGRPDQLENA